MGSPPQQRLHVLLLRRALHGRAGGCWIAGLHHLIMILNQCLKYLQTSRHISTVKDAVQSRIESLAVNSLPDVGSSPHFIQLISPIIRHRYAYDVCKGLCSIL